MLKQPDFFYLSSNTEYLNSFSKIKCTFFFFLTSPCYSFSPVMSGSYGRVSTFVVVVADDQYLFEKLVAQKILPSDSSVNVV